MGLGRDIRIDPAVSRLHSTHCESKPGQSDRYEPTKKVKKGCEVNQLSGDADTRKKNEPLLSWFIPIRLPRFAWFTSSFHYRSVPCFFDFSNQKIMISTDFYPEMRVHQVRSLNLFAWGLSPGLYAT